MRRSYPAGSRAEAQIMLPRIFYLERWLTWLAHRLSRSRLLAPLLIWIHRKLYVVNMEEAEPSAVGEYHSFAAYFTRHLKPETRPIAENTSLIVSPCDGTMLAQGTITKDGVLEAKGYNYSLSELIDGGNELLGGQHLTIYLGPADYHRIHAPTDLNVLRTHYIGGRLFSVNAGARSRIPMLFSRNERLVITARGSFGNLVMVMVGAQLVSGIHTQWRPEGYGFACGQQEVFAGGLTPRFERGEDMAHFAFGSTLILLLPPKVATMKSERAGAHIRFGETIGTLTTDVQR